MQDRKINHTRKSGEVGICYKKTLKNVESERENVFDETRKNHVIYYATRVTIITKIAHM